MNKIFVHNRHDRLKSKDITSRSCCVWHLCWHSGTGKHWSLTGYGDLTSLHEDGEYDLACTHSLDTSTSSRDLRQDILCWTESLSSTNTLTHSTVANSGGSWCYFSARATHCSPDISLLPTWIYPWQYGDHLISHCAVHHSTCPAQVTCRYLVVGMRSLPAHKVLWPAGIYL